MMQKIKNIIFDLGGVLVDLNEQSCIEAFEAIHAPTVGDYVRDHRTEDLFWDIEIGNSTTEEFCHEARRISGTTADNERIIWAWNQLLPGIADKTGSWTLSLYLAMGMMVVAIFIGLLALKLAPMNKLHAAKD